MKRREDIFEERRGFSFSLSVETGFLICTSTAYTEEMDEWDASVGTCTFLGVTNLDVVDGVLVQMLGNGRHGMDEVRWPSLSCLGVDFLVSVYVHQICKFSLLVCFRGERVRHRPLPDSVHVAYVRSRTSSV